VFFKTAFNGSFQEGTGQDMSLPEDDVQIFRIYQTWLNTGQLRYNFDKEECWLHLGKLWIFADKICSTRLMNKTVDAFFEVVTKNSDLPFADPETVNYVFGKTMPGSPLRRMFVRIFLSYGYILDDDEMNAYPREFLATALRKAMSKTKIMLSVAPPVTEYYHEDCCGPCCKHGSVAEPISSSAHPECLVRTGEDI